MAADKVLSALTAASSLAATDIVYVMQDPSGTALDRKSTITVLASGIVSAATALTPQFAGLGIGEAGASGTITATRSDAATTPTLSLKQASTGDVGICLALTGARAYSLAIDNSDSDALKISTGAAGTAAAGTGDLAKLTSDGVFTIPSSTGGLGYSTGAGGTVTQSSNKGAAVTLNRPCGEVTMHNAALAADTTVAFAINNSLIAAGDTVVLNHVSGGTIGSYLLHAACGSGSAIAYVRNITAGSLSEAIVIRFAVIKGATS